MSNEADLPLFLTAEEMATLLRTTRQVIYNMVSKFQLPGVTRIGRRVLFRRTEVLRWLRENSVPSP